MTTPPVSSHKKTRPMKHNVASACYVKATPKDVMKLRLNTRFESILIFVIPRHRNDAPPWEVEARHRRVSHRHFNKFEEYPNLL